MQTAPGASYFPTWMEIGAIVGLVGFGLLAFMLAAQFLPLFDEKPAAQ